MKMTQRELKTSLKNRWYSPTITFSSRVNEFLYAHSLHIVKPNKPMSEYVSDVEFEDREVFMVILNVKRSVFNTTMNDLAKALNVALTAMMEDLQDNLPPNQCLLATNRDWLIKIFNIQMNEFFYNPDPSMFE